MRLTSDCMVGWRLRSQYDDDSDDENEECSDIETDDEEMSNNNSNDIDSDSDCSSNDKNEEPNGTTHRKVVCGDGIVNWFVKS